MSALSFVALELQTTHLDPASVSRASYVKLVNGNITRTDALLVTPPTLNDGLETTSPETSLSWSQALSQLTMMVGQLPIVSYYRDADKEVFQAASRYIDAEPPTLHWLDCRELARKYLPDLPEFQLSTVLKSLDLDDEYGDSESVEQTAQIVVELARLHEATSVEELWGDLYDQPDKLLGLDAGLDGINFIAEPTLTSEQPSDQEQNQAELGDLDEGQDGAALADPVDRVGDPDESLTAESGTETKSTTPLEPWPEVETSSEMDAPNREDSETLTNDDDFQFEEHERLDGAASQEAIDDEAVIAEVVSEPSTDSASLAEDKELKGSELEDIPQQQPAPEELGASSIDVASDDDVTENQSVAATLPEEYATKEQLDERPESISSPIDTADVTTTEVTNVPAADAAEAAQSEEQSVELAEASTVTGQTQTGPVSERSRTLRTLGFIGLFGFGLLTIVGVVLTIMAVMLFFTDNALLLETKIAGVVLTGAVTLLGLLMTTISYQSFKKY